MKILLADDSATARYVVQTAVESLGHECEIAEDGLQAWEAFKRFDPEVVISDWEMPGLDGEELCKRIRAIPDAPYTYFIMLTSRDDPGYVVRGMRAGADDYLTKPLVPEELEVRLIAASRVTALHSNLRRRQHETDQEIKRAASIQQGLLPGATLSLSGATVAGSCFPATNVGGDCFDYAADAQGRLFIFIADVAGHSISSALLMAMGRSTLRREIAAGASPATVLAVTNRTMFRDLVTVELFITMFCASYDPAARTLQYANAGHNPPLLQRGSEVIELDADGAAIGLLEEVVFEQGEVTMAAGDRLLLYTDGATEARDETGQQFGAERLRALMRDEPDATPAAFLEHVYGKVRAHSGKAPQQDDVTLVVLGAEDLAYGSLERRVAERTAELETQNERLLELDEWKDDLVASVSHELRTPLTSIRGYTELALSDDESQISERQRGYLDVVLRNTAHLTKLIDDLLFTARVGAGQFELALGDIDLTDLVAYSVKLAQPSAETSGIEVSGAAEPDLRLHGDRQRISQALDNLISNGIKFTPPGGVVTISAMQRGDRVVIEVADTGTGISAADQKKLFERFFRSPSAASVQGTGLGLSIVRAITEAHRGAITVESELGVGTTFRIELPLTQRQAAS